MTGVFEGGVIAGITMVVVQGIFSLFRQSAKGREKTEEAYLGFADKLIERFTASIDRLSDKIGEVVQNYKQSQDENRVLREDLKKVIEKLDDLCDNLTKNRETAIE